MSSELPRRMLDGGEEVEMKTLLVMLTLAAAVAVVAFDQSSSTAARTGFPGAQPSATPAGQVTLYGHIGSLQQVGGRVEMRFDPAWLTKGSPHNARAGGSPCRTTATSSREGTGC